jgi:hypothetical protein
MRTSKRWISRVLCLVPQPSASCLWEHLMTRILPIRGIMVITTMVIIIFPLCTRHLANAIWREDMVESGPHHSQPLSTQHLFLGDRWGQCFLRYDGVTFMWWIASSQTKFIVVLAKYPAELRPKICLTEELLFHASVIQRKMQWPRDEGLGVGVGARGIEIHLFS